MQTNILSNWRTFQDSFNTPPRNSEEANKKSANKNANSREKSSESMMQMLSDSWKEAQFKASRQASSLRGSLSSPLSFSQALSPNSQRNSLGTVPSSSTKPPMTPQSIKTNNIKEKSTERVLKMCDSRKEAQDRQKSSSSFRKSLNSSMSQFSPMKRSIETEIDFRRMALETYTEPIRPRNEEEIEGLKTYLSEFYRTIYKRADEIKELMEQHPDSVGKYFDYLVKKSGEVSYEDFWLRYFYRCDEKRVQFDWKQERSKNAETEVEKEENDEEGEVEITFS